MNDYCFSIGDKCPRDNPDRADCIRCEEEDENDMRPTEEFVNDFMQRVEEGKYDRPDPDSMISQEDINALLGEADTEPMIDGAYEHDIRPDTYGKDCSHCRYAEVCEAVRSCGKFSRINEEGQLKLEQIKGYIVEVLMDEYMKGYRDAKAEAGLYEDDLK